MLETKRCHHNLILTEIKTLLLQCKSCNFAFLQQFLLSIRIDKNLILLKLLCFIEIMYLILENLQKTYFEPYPDTFQAYPVFFPHQYG